MDWCNAIETRSLVRFQYEGHERVVAPAAYGVHATTGNLVLRGYQTGGTSNSRAVPFWSLFLVDQVVGATITGENFSENPPGYTPNDKHIGTIHCQLT
jgi:hypothetical protein